MGVESQHLVLGVEMIYYLQILIQECQICYNGKSAIYVGRAKNPSGAPFSVQLQANLFISATGTTSL